MSPRYSPGDWHTHVPTDLVGNVRYRLWLLRKCRSEPAFRLAVRRMCREDIFYFIAVFVWQFNPNSCGPSSPQLSPLVPWPFQAEGVREMLRAIEDRRDLVFEKSRDMGASWFILVVVAWFYLFVPCSKMLCMSRDEKSVDKSDEPDCLFWKLRFIFDRLPEWLLPPAAHSDKKLGFANRETGAVITGTASTGKAGVGGRATFMFIDEFSQIDEDWEVLERTSDTTGCRIFCGTHKGLESAFNDLCGRASASGFTRKLVWHWTMHPDKWPGAYEATEGGGVKFLDPGYKYPDGYEFVTDGKPLGGPRPHVRSPWYDVACLKKGTDRGIATDLDINPGASVEQAFDQLMIRDLVTRYARPPAWTGHLAADDAARPLGLTPAAGGPLALWCRLGLDGNPPAGPYVIGADVSYGVGSTPSCVTVLNAVTGEKVAAFSDPNTEPHELAVQLVALARVFRDHDDSPARVAWEIPGPGNNVTKKVLELGFTNIYTKTVDHSLKKTVSDTPGWSNNAQAQTVLLVEYKRALSARRFVNRCELALNECLAFRFDATGNIVHTGSKDPKDPSAARAGHGDRVIADALAWKLAAEGGRLVAPGAAAGGQAVAPVGSLAWRMIRARAERDAAERNFIAE